MPEYKTVEYETERNLDVTPVSVQNVKALVPKFNQRIDDWAAGVEADIENRIQVEIGKIDPSLLASVRIERRVVGKTLDDGTYYPGQKVEIENIARIVRLFDSDVEIYSPGDKETFVEQSGDGFYVKDNKLYAPASPRVSYIKFKTKAQLPASKENLGKTLEYELVAKTSHSIDTGYAYIPITETIAPSSDLNGMDWEVFLGVANMAAAYPQDFINWATEGKTVTIPWNGVGNITYRIIAVSQYERVDGGRIGFVLMPTCVPTAALQDSNYLPGISTSNYEKCGFHANEDSIIQKYLPLKWQNIIETVKLPCTQSKTGPVVEVPSRAFPLSAMEMGGPNIDFSSATYEKEGTQMPYWSSHNTNQDRVLKLLGNSGATSSYQLRSLTTYPQGVQQMTGVYVGDTGQIYKEPTMGPVYIVPCICIGNSGI